MTSVPELNLFHVVGVAVAASQIFETVFVMSARLALKQSDAEVFEDIVPVSASKALKQPIKALLKELGEAQLLEPDLERRVSRLIEDRHRVIHRALHEFGWPTAMPPEKEAAFRQLATKVAAESQAMSIVFVDLLLTWMKRFPATSPTATKHEAQFRELAVLIRSQSEAANAA